MSLFDEPLKWIAHGHIFERLQYISLKVYAETHPETYSIDGGECTGREVHTLPHTRQTASPVDHGCGVGTLEGLGGASKSFWPGEELCGICITPTSYCTCVC